MKRIPIFSHITSIYISLEEKNREWIVAQKDPGGPSQRRRSCGNEDLLEVSGTVLELIADTFRFATADINESGDFSKILANTASGSALELRGEPGPYLDSMVEPESTSILGDIAYR
ncbi:hypothetical protein EVAR_97084_1 [Eumeta japonica]|uniref:Uncharacterized protein n=1 Tax=Eumeta variegata TaxID=151549 RepID=A0A4C1X4N2_EUMVA|nr:hypothetical protein EVAR_97084_1 [Eumeta japonica]